MKRAILHIGRHKTGTTSLQLVLQRQAEHMARHGVCYPKTGRSSEAHHDLARALLNHPSATAVAKLRADLLRETEAADTIVISSEAFQNIQDFEPLKALLDGFDVTVVCYLREALAYCASAYAEEVKGSALYSDFETFTAFFSRALHYPLFVEAWQRTGWCLDLRSYDLASNVVDDFVTAMGLTIAVGDTRQPQGNAALSGNALGFKLLVNLLGLHTPSQKPVLMKLAKEYAQFRGPFRISAQAAMEMRRGSENNAWLTRQFGAIPMQDFADGWPIMDRRTCAQDFRDILEFYRRREFQHLNVVEITRDPILLSLLLETRAR